MKRVVVYVTAGRWPGTLVVVTEEKSWGIVGYMPMPNGSDRTNEVVGKAYVRINTEDFTVVGEIEDGE
jgi:hypothetical protein